jgi:hypothetical protein
VLEVEEEGLIAESLGIIHCGSNQSLFRSNVLLRSIGTPRLTGRGGGSTGTVTSNSGF